MPPKFSDGITTIPKSVDSAPKISSPDEKSPEGRNKSFVYHKNTSCMLLFDQSSDLSVLHKKTTPEDGFLINAILN